MYDRSVVVVPNAVDGLLFARAMEPSDYIADKVFDPRLVPKTSVLVPQVNTEALRLYNTRKGHNAVADIIQRSIFKRTITLEHHKLAAETDPSEVEDAADAFKWLYSDTEQAQLVLDGLLNNREAIAASIATDATRFPSALQSTLSAGDRWDDTGDIEAHMVTANSALRAKCGRRANALAISEDTYDKLRLGSNLRDRIKYTNGGPIPDEAIKAFFRIQHLFVGASQINTAIEGATENIVNAWGRFALAFVYKPSTSRSGQCSFGHLWQVNSGFTSKIIMDPDRSGTDGEMRKVQLATKYLMDPGFVESSTSSKFAAGYLFTTCVGA